MKSPTFSFEQLSTKAQDNALEVCRYINTLETHWYEELNDSTLEKLLELLGFENTKIYFSLGYCQSDYAKLDTANFHYSKGFVKAIKTEFPKWSAAHQIAEQLLNICKQYFFGYSFSLNNGRTCNFEHKRLGADWQHDIGPFEDKIDDFMTDLNNLLYQSYRDEYESLTSDSAVKNSLIELDYKFFADGSDKQTIYSNAA